MSGQWKAIGGLAAGGIESITYKTEVEGIEMYRVDIQPGAHGVGETKLAAIQALRNKLDIYLRALGGA